jgi:hypothetical protein
MFLLLLLLNFVVLGVVGRFSIHCQLAKVVPYLAGQSFRMDLISSINSVMLYLANTKQQVKQVFV